MKIVNATGLENLSIEEPTFCDTEGGGLYIDIRLIQVYQPTKSEDIIFYDTDEINLEQCKDYIRPLHTVWWNAPYDCGALNMTSAKIDDLQKAVKIAYPEFQEYALDIVAKKLGLGHFYDGLNKKELQKSRFLPGAYLSHEQKRYAAVDVLILAEIWKDKKVQQVIQNNVAYKVDMLSLEYCVQYQQNGIPVHRENLLKQMELNKSIVDENQAKIDKYIQEKFIELDSNYDTCYTIDIQIKDKKTIYINSKTKTEVTPDFISTWKGKVFNKPWSKWEIFNSLRQTKLGVNSWQQLRLLFQSNDSDAPYLLRQISEGNELARWILDCKRAGKQLSYMESIKPFEKMYTKFKPGGAATGRFTADGGDLPNGFNAQQIPRKLKHIFGVPENGDKILVGADYSTLELRLAAAIYKDKNMYSKLMGGADLHAETAKAMIGHSNYTKDDRQNAKPVNFGYTFGMGIATFIEMAFNDYGLVFSEEQAKTFRKKFFEAYPNIAAYHNNIWNAMQQGNYIYSTALGRRTMPKLGTDAINGPVQGTGAETTKLAIHYMCKENPDTVKKIINVVHDSITLCVDNTPEEIEYWSELLKRCMVKGWTEISKTNIMYYKDIPMIVEVGKGYEYGKAS